MWTIRDTIVGEIIVYRHYLSAIKNAQSRVKEHNREFSYSHRGKHYNQNATYTINKEKREIVIERG